MSAAYVSTELRRLVAARAGQRCEYCLMAESESFATFEVDHIVAQKHGGETVANNLAYCCPLCNKYKGSDVASYDPETADSHHLQQTAKIIVANDKDSPA